LKQKKHAWKGKEWDEHSIDKSIAEPKSWTLSIVYVDIYLCAKEMQQGFWCPVTEIAAPPVSLSPFLSLIFGKHQFVSVKLAPELRYATPVPVHASNSGQAWTMAMYLKYHNLQITYAAASVRCEQPDCKHPALSSSVAAISFSA
jgi:hypothetical protein